MFYVGKAVEKHVKNINELYISIFAFKCFMNSKSAKHVTDPALYFDTFLEHCFLFDDGPYKYRSIWNYDVFFCCCFGNIKTLDQTLVEL